MFCIFTVLKLCSVLLWIGCFSGWMEFLIYSRILPWTWTKCNLPVFLFRFGRHYSSTLLVLMSIEKCFAVYFPFKSKTVCTVRTAKWATGIVGVILAGYNTVHFFVTKLYIIKSSAHHICVTDVRYVLILKRVDSIHLHLLF